MNETCLLITISVVLVCFVYLFKNQISNLILSMAKRFGPPPPKQDITVEYKTPLEFTTVEFKTPIHIHVTETHTPPPKPQEETKKRKDYTLL